MLFSQLVERMTRRDLSLTIALCASLLAHGVLALVTFEGAARQLATIRLPGYPRPSNDVIAAAAPDAVRLGGVTNDGLAPNESPGEENIRATDAPVDQALLSRDPRGPGRIGGLPSDSLLPQMSGPTVDGSPLHVVVRSALAPVLPIMTDAPQPFGAGPDAGAAIIVPRPRPPQPGAMPEPAHAQSPKPAADPAMMSDSESDAFSTLGGIDFRDGRIESRLGRAFKSVRPRLSLPAQIEMMSLAEKRIVLKIAIDATGKVQSVDVLRSTGSNLIDQPVKLAMYEWWFEPPKGADGQGMAETIVLPIRWH